jgi:FixJ family two-component response regulator
MPSRRNRFVYVVDDDDDVRDSTQELLQSTGIEVRAFASGREFLDKFDPSAGSCIVLDLHMPDMSGFQVLDILHARGNTIPIILFTGRCDPTTEKFARQSGVIALLAKSIDHDELIEQVQRLVAKSLAA